MSEASLRRFHRALGMIILVFLAVQVITGLSFSLSHLTMPPLFRNPRWMYALHHGGGAAGEVYRIVLALTALLQAGSGAVIFLRSRLRKSKAKGQG